LGKQQPYIEVPFFWTEQFDIYLYYVGYASDWDEIIYQGAPEERQFVAFFVKHDQVMAAAGCGFDQGMAYLGGLMRTGQMPRAGEIRSGQAELLKYFKQ